MVTGSSLLKKVNMAVNLVDDLCMLNVCDGSLVDDWCMLYVHHATCQKPRG